MLYETLQQIKDRNISNAMRYLYNGKDWLSIQESEEWKNFSGEKWTAWGRFVGQFEQYQDVAHSIDAYKFFIKELGFIIEDFAEISSSKIIVKIKGAVRTLPPEKRKEMALNLLGIAKETPGEINRYILQEIKGIDVEACPHNEKISICKNCNHKV